MPSKNGKPKVATASLAGCFGCHMALLDIDERILKLIELVDFDKSPVNDLKKFTVRCAVGLIEGGCCNEENVHVLRDFREHCDVLISVGDMRHHGWVARHAQHDSVAGVPAEAYLNGPTVHNPAARSPTIRKSRCCSTGYPCNEIVKIDSITCPAAAPADTLWQALVALLSASRSSCPTSW